jgi:hypothetical protein
MLFPVRIATLPENKRITGSCAFVRSVPMLYNEDTLPIQMAKLEEQEID